MGEADFEWAKGRECEYDQNMLYACMEFLEVLDIILKNLHSMSGLLTMFTHCPLSNTSFPYSAKAMRETDAEKR